MIFPYFNVSPKIKRPIIPIVLSSKTSFIIYAALVDSGSDYCIFSIELAYALGINLAKNKIEIQGIGKDKVYGYWGKVEARVGDIDFKMNVIFAEISEFGHGLLGQKGFFDNFIVKFDRAKEEIELTSRK